MNVTLHINPILKLNVIEVLLFPFGFFIVASCCQAVAATKRQELGIPRYFFSQITYFRSVSFNCDVLLHFIISYHDEQNFSVCYRTVSPLGNIGKYFAIVKWKVIFPILQILTWENGNLVIRSRIGTVGTANVIKLLLT
jgi:hypothetical protein